MTDRPLKRIKLDEAGPEWAGEWVDIFAHRTWADTLEAQDAYSKEGIVGLKRTAMRLCVSRWSFAADPLPEAFEQLDARVMEFIYDRALDWYQGAQRDEEATKSPAARTDAADESEATASAG